MLDLYLIRHAESQMNNQSHLIGGRSNDSPLSPRGVEQAVLLGRRLLREGVSFDRVYSSTAARAYQTAGIASKFASYPLEKIVQSDDLLELDQGQWEGIHRDLAYTPENIQLINADPWRFAAPGGESQKQVEERMMAWLYANMMDQEANLRAGVFTHGMAIKCLLRGVMDFRPELTYKVVSDNTSITRLKYTSKGWHVLCVNDVAHLQGLEKIEDRHSE